MRFTALRAATAACILTGALAPAALAAQRSSDVKRPWQDVSGAADRVAGDRSQFSAGGPPTISAYLPGALENFEVVSRFKSDAPFGDVKPGQIADVSVHKGFAYLNFWDDDAGTCARGGVQVVDINDPKNPKQAAFIPAVDPYYHGEGAHVISMDTPQFKGDLLAVNNEVYSNCDDETGYGGFDLYDVTDPRNPKTLVQVAGDFDSDNDPATPADARPNDFHSVFVWQDGPRAYLVGVDNFETTDVDIFDITDPKNPEQIGDFELAELFPEIAENEEANGALVQSHDMVVKKIGDKQVMLFSYWDAGYVQLDVTDPKTPKLITDTDFIGADPLTGDVTAEGNAHQAEFSNDNQFFLAADEDFAPYRAGKFTIDGVEFPAQEVGGGKSPATLPDVTLNGPTFYGGYGCDASNPVPTRASINPTLAAGEEAIIVLQRGPSEDPSDPAPEACFPGEKARNGTEAGWDAVLLTNRHLGSVDDDWAFCGSGDFDGTEVATLCTSHAGLHKIFGITDGDFSTPVAGGHHPALGTPGLKVSGESEFDGWGYAHLFDAKTSERLDSFAIPEGVDARYATGFGDLSIHEFATDPTEPIAYSAYYAAASARSRSRARAGCSRPASTSIPPGRTSGASSSSRAPTASATSPVRTVTSAW